MSLWRTYYHVVWATKDRAPLIDDGIAPDLHGYLRGKAGALGLIVHAVGGVQDHVHVVLSISPTHAVADVVRQLKGASSYHVTEQSETRRQFQWQRGYGVFTLGARQLPDAVAYVKSQREHHRDGTTIAALEQSLDKDDGPGPGGK